MPGLRSRSLRWQLTLSHMLAIAVTLVSMLGALALVAHSWYGIHRSPTQQVAQDARGAAAVVERLVSSPPDPTLLNPVLRALASGQLALGQSGGPGWRVGDGLTDTAYLVVMAPDGTVLGSSDAAGAAFDRPERGEWSTLASQAAAVRFSRVEDVAVAREGSGPAVIAATRIENGNRAASPVLILARQTLPPDQLFFNPVATIAFFGVATVLALIVASILAFLPSSAVGYLLSKRLVRRIERLGSAAEALAAGDTSVCVEPGNNDELGVLAGRFNAMAGDLERTVGALQAERDRVSGLLDARRQLVAGVSHELRTPVATIRGYLESALQGGRDLEADLRTEMETMERELLRLQRLIEDLFTLSRSEVGRLTLRLEPTDAGALVQRLVDTIAPLAWTQRRVEIVAQIPADLPPARADAERLEQVVSNLLSNAVRHTPPGGLVAAALEATDTHLILEVCDTGEGISPQDLPHVFERYYQGGSDGLGQGGGAGLGLTLVKELVEAMGGTAEAASTPGEGSAFRVHLPRA